MCINTIKSWWANILSKLSHKDQTDNVNDTTIQPQTTEQIARYNRRQAIEGKLPFQSKILTEAIENDNIIGGGTFQGDAFVESFGGVYIPDNIDAQSKTIDTFFISPYTISILATNVILPPNEWMRLKITGNDNEFNSAYYPSLCGPVTTNTGVIDGKAGIAIFLKHYNLENLMSHIDLFLKRDTHFTGITDIGGICNPNSEYNKRKQMNQQWNSPDIEEKIYTACFISIYIVMASILTVTLIYIIKKSIKNLPKN